LKAKPSKPDLAQINELQLDPIVPSTTQVEISELIKPNANTVYSCESSHRSETCITEAEHISIPNPTGPVHLSMQLEGTVQPKKSSRSSFWGFFWNQSRRIAVPSHEMHHARQTLAKRGVVKDESVGDLSITSGVCETCEEQIVMQPMQTIAERTETSEDLPGDNATKRLLQFFKKPQVLGLKKVQTFTSLFSQHCTHQNTAK
jgi:hypothetical protein